jgi:hypothetical protein
LWLLSLLSSYRNLHTTENNLIPKQGENHG